MKYVICSDQHMHDWREFSSQNKNGINNRLQITIDELLRVSKTAKEKSADMIVFAGDFFHQPGHIRPSVFNPAYTVISEMAKQGPEIVIIPGNHDLEFNSSNPIGSSVFAFDYIEGVKVLHQPTVYKGLALFPWQKDMGLLIQSMKEFAANDRVAIIHAPLNDVLYGIPNTGLVADDLANLGYRAVFAGHYHNHKAFDNDVFSIGALGHQTWSDVGSLAGHIWLDTEKKVVEHVPSAMPSFVKLQSGEYDGCEGNYCKVMDVESGMEEAVRSEYLNRGAKYALIHTKTTVQTSTVRARVENNLTATVAGHCDKNGVSNEDTEKCLERVNEV